VCQPFWKNIRFWKSKSVKIWKSEFGKGGHKIGKAGFGKVGNWVGIPRESSMSNSHIHFIG